MRRKAHWALLLTIGGCCLVTTSGCGAPTASTSLAEDTRNATAEQGALKRVVAAPAIRKTLIRTTSQPGRIEAFEEAPLYAKVSGYVEKVLVDIGDRVEVGEVLIKLSIPEMHDDLHAADAAVAEAEAQVAQADALLRLAAAAVETATAGYDQAQAGVVRAEADFELRQAEHARIKELAAGGSVTEKLVDETRHQYKAADAARKEAEANVASAKAVLKQADANVHKAEADLLTAKAKLRVAQTQRGRAQTLLDYSEIKAPFSGVITRRHVDTGHYVAADGKTAKPLLIVTRADVVRVFVDIPEVEAPLVGTGSDACEAVVRVPALGTREFRGTVTRTAWSLDAGNRSLLTEIDLPNEEGLLRPGMYATADIVLAERRDALVLPASAVRHNSKGSECLGVANGQIVRRPVKIGLRSGNEVEVLSGIGEDDVIVLSSGDGFEEGQPVEVVMADSAR